MTEKQPIWWVSWKGEVRYQPEKPAWQGWSSCTPPEDTPEEFNNDEDYWLHFVGGPAGEPCFVRMRVVDGRWESLGVIPKDEVENIVREARQIYGVANDAGEPMDVEKWS